MTENIGLRPRVVYRICLSQPLTAKELCETLEAPRTSVNAALTDMWRAGLLVRRRRETDTRNNPHEYAIRVPEENE